MTKLHLVIFFKVCIYMCYCFDKNPCLGRPWTVTIVYRTNTMNYLSNEFELINSSLQKKFNGKVVTAKAEMKENLDLLGNLDYFNEMNRSDRSVTVFVDVRDFYKQDYNKILNRKYKFAGNGTPTVLLHTVEAKMCDVVVCKMTEPDLDKTEFILFDDKHFPGNENRCNKENRINPEFYRDLSESCILTKEHQYNVKLISTNTFELLQKFIEKIPENDFDHYEVCPLLNIIVCKKETDAFHRRKPNQGKTVYKLNEVIIQNEHECKSKTDDFTIAVLAPTPFDATSVDPTTIFYGDEYITSKAISDAYDNSFTWMPVEKIMFGLHSFMNLKKWNRVAVISDASPISQVFEEQITELLEKDKFIYISRLCDVTDKFAEIISPLIKAGARIMIANVEDGSKLAKQAKHWNDLVWLFRSHTAAKAAVRSGMNKVFAVTLEKTNPNSCKSYNCILEVIKKHLKESGEYYLDELQLKRKNFESVHRKFAKYIKHQLHNMMTVKAFVRRIDAQNTPSVAVLTISPTNKISGNLELKHKNLVNFHKEPTGCALKSSVYMKPCYDYEFIFFMLIFSVFLLMVLVIVYYFQSAEFSYTRFSN